MDAFFLSVPQPCAIVKCTTESHFSTVEPVIFSDDSNWHEILADAKTQCFGTKK